MLSRRAFLASASAAALLPATVAAKTVAPAWPDGLELAARIRSGRTTALLVTEAAIRRAEQTQPAYNYLVATDFDRARERARSYRPGATVQPFGGVPTLIKDLSDVIGLPTRDGSRVGLLAKPATSQDVLVDAFEKAGFNILGKSSTPEFAFLATTEPLAFGPTRNPWDPTRSAGGSSGGAAVAVALGVVPVAHANDGGGSIRMPASCCGVFGMKPSRGRVIRPRPNTRPIDLAMQGVISRSVRDTAASLAFLEQGADPLLRPVGAVTQPIRRKLKIGLVLQGVGGVEPDGEVRGAIEDSARLLQSLGHHIEPTRWPFAEQTFIQDFLTYWATQAHRIVGSISEKLGKKPDETMFEPFTLAMARQIQSLPPGAVEAAIVRLRAAAAGYDSWFANYDVILSPVLAEPPVKLGYISGDVPFETLVERMMRYLPYTPIHNVAGAPAVSVPLSWSKGGLPIGTHLAARYGDDRTLLELSLQLEAARPWAGKMPPVK